MHGMHAYFNLFKLIKHNACTHAYASTRNIRNLQIQPVDGLGTGFASLELGVTSVFFTVMHALINN